MKIYIRTCIYVYNQFSFEFYKYDSMGLTYKFCNQFNFRYNCCCRLPRIRHRSTTEPKNLPRRTQPGQPGKILCLGPKPEPKPLFMARNLLLRRKSHRRRPLRQRDHWRAVRKLLFPYSPRPPRPLPEHYLGRLPGRLGPMQPTQTVKLVPQHHLRRAQSHRNEKLGGS